MTLDDFRPLMVRVEAWWPGTRWDEAMIAVWFEDLQRFETPVVRGAFERLKREHVAPFAPGIGEVLRLLERPELPIGFDDMLGLVYKAASFYGPERLDYLERRAPLVAQFVQLQGTDRVFTLQLDDPEWGEQRRRELREAWDRHCERMDGREIVRLAAGSEGLRQLDPLATLQLGSGPDA